MSCIPVVVFFYLIIAGVWLDQLELSHAVVFLVIWAAGLAIFKFLDLPGLLFVGIEALLAIVLALKIFGGDIRIR